MTAPRPLDGQLSLLHDVPIYRTCQLCGRVLTDAQSIRLRAGRRCRRKLVVNTPPLIERVHGHRN